MKPRLLLLAILLIIGASLIFFGGKEEAPSDELKNETSSTTPVSVDDNDQSGEDFILSEGSKSQWTRYADTKYGFSLEYPTEYQVVSQFSRPAYNGDKEPLADFSRTAAADDDFSFRGISISVFPTEGYYFRDIPGAVSFEFDRVSEECLVDDYGITNSPEGKIAIEGGLFGCRVSSGDGSGVLRGVFIPLLEKNIVVQMYLHGSVRDGQVGFTAAEIDEIAKTLRLID